jgi:hypothetical protein
MVIFPVIASDMRILASPPGVMRVRVGDTATGVPAWPRSVDAPGAGVKMSCSA